LIIVFGLLDYVLNINDSYYTSILQHTLTYYIMMKTAIIFSFLLMACLQSVYSLRSARLVSYRSSTSLFAKENKIETTQFAERIESVKSGIVAAVAGSIGFAPYAIIAGLIQGFDGNWEFNHDMFALTLGLFGITYRYAVRNSSNPQLKMGVVSAFALTRILNLIHVPDICTAFPLNCGPPLYYVSSDMVLSGVSVGVESFLGYGIAGAILDYCFYRKFIKQFVE
jgi:hypothetical protein